ncbi:hypothetical protein [Brucella intermedia]|uniref:Uncharacterized protein n=1 Tax=Brucella intermedia M86 TaxID=1234597 RepID=M5JKR3_9HYPH|nr:hypothetical protein [Brucella intermedia]ELT47047.1 hypothetical protein D584_21571 [Brucella intermedia M86]
MAKEKGIAVTIKGFIPVDPLNLESHRNAIDAAMKAKSGQFSALETEEIDFRLDSFNADLVTRRSKDDDAEE